MEQIESGHRIQVVDIYGSLAYWQQTKLNMLLQICCPQAVAPAQMKVRGWNLSLWSY